MEENQDNTEALPCLFPAYSAQPEKQTSGTNKGDTAQEWLVNSSFTSETFKAVFEVGRCTESLGSSDDVESSVQHEEIPVKVKKKRKKKKKKHDLEKKVAKLTEKRASELYHASSFIRNHLNKLTFLEETGLSYERAYRIDRQLDQEILLYGSLDRKTIAKYYCRYNAPLGCSRSEASAWLKTKQKEKSSHSQRYFSKQNSKHTKSVHSGEKIIGKKFDRVPQLPLFLSLIVEPKDKFDSGIDNIATKSVSNEGNNLVLSDSISDDSISLFEPELQQKVAYFNNAVTVSPHDEQLWLDFVEFQHRLYMSKSFYKQTSSMEKNLIEKQISILDKALKHNPNSISLTVAKLKLLRNMKEIEELVSLWENFIFYYPQNIDAWQQYLNFVVMDISYFTVTRISKVYSKCLRKLSDIDEGILKSHRAPPNLQYDMIDLFSQLCTIYGSCGYMERAVANFQALVGININIPTVVIESSCADRITYFESYWDSGAPRAGEANAVGWARTVSEQRTALNAVSSVLSLNDLEDEILSLKLPEWQTWLKFETLRASKHWLPWCPDLSCDQTVEDLDDPERIITYDQITPHLFKIQDENMLFSLLCHFLNFLKVQLHSMECSYFPYKKENLFLLNDIAFLHSSLAHLFPSKIPNCLHIKNHFDFPDTEKFIENLFEQMIIYFSDKYKSLVSFLWLRHHVKVALNDVHNKENNKSVKCLKKLAKSMLKKKENRNCLYLWNEYLAIESFNGVEESGQKMFETLLISSFDTCVSNSGTYKELWYFARRYIELYCGMMSNISRTVCVNKAYIIWILSHVGCKEKYTVFIGQDIKPTFLVRAQAGFKASMNEESTLLDDKFHLCMCLEPYAYPFLDCTVCAIILQYFTHSLEASQAVFENALQLLQNAKGKTTYAEYIEEQLYVFYAKLLVFHVHNFSGSRKSLQNHLYQSVEKYPGNAELLYLLVKMKTSMAVIGSTRRFFYKLHKTPHVMTPVTWLFAILSELVICYSIEESYGLTHANIEEESTLIKEFGIMWKIRSLFERALQSSESRNCVMLWRCFIRFEVFYGDVSRAKVAFHEALQNCPWSKDLVLDGVNYFKDDMYQQLLQLMIEKQLRTHTPQEEVSLLLEHGLKDVS